MRQKMIDSLNENGFKYCESNYWNNPAYSDIERELVRFRWGKPEYKGHFKVYHKIHYFDDFIMGEIENKVKEYNWKVKRGVLHERV